ERRLDFGKSLLQIQVAVQLNGLNPEDVTVEADHAWVRKARSSGRARHYPLSTWE
ncbi:MAG: hypothetical protein IPP03_22710, partial [Dechloromonas sp.]|nr:hypothetical protein [Candidatus Dechloromonas phosphoritropha]